jgi:endonuclease/exonuclease/phosphatase family metal-dependent hydrolase
MTVLFLRLGLATLLAISFTGRLPAAPVTQLKVMSFNIWVSGSSGLTQCVAAIRASGADLVGLQECNAAAAQMIATNLGFHLVSADGCPIVSRYPIVASNSITYSRRATVELSPGQRVHFFNTHLTAYPYGPYDLKHGKPRGFIVEQENKVRTKNLNAVLATMKPFIDGNEPCFLVGDFNAPSHFDYSDFPWPTSIACVNAGLVDSYHELHSQNRKHPGLFKFDEPGITWTPKTGEEPEGVFDRIDFIYYSKGDARPTKSIELDQRNCVDPWPSDHRAVMTTFTLTPPTAVGKPSAP